MGNGITFLVWALLGTAPACLAALLFGGAAAYATRNAGHERKKLVLAIGAFPVACVFWAGLMFSFQAAVNVRLLQRDSGFGDISHCPLPNGYALLMVGTKESGFVYNPRTQKGVLPEPQQNAVGSVEGLQVSGQYLLGSTEPMAWPNGKEAKNTSSSYFLLDTQAGSLEKFADYSALQARATEIGIRAQLQPIATVYSRYRTTWFEIVVLLLLVAPPVIVALRLIRRTMQLRRAAISPGVAVERPRFHHTRPSASHVLS